MMQHRRWWSAVAMLVSGVVLVSCAGTPVGPGAMGTNPAAAGDPARAPADPHAVVPLPEAPSPTLPVTITDASGTQVTVTDVSRIVPLVGSVAEIVFSLGLGERVVGRDVAATFAQAEGLPLVTHGHDVSAEGVLALRPTVVLADTSTGPPEALEQLRRTGVAVVIVDEAWTLDHVAPRIRAVAEALGVPAAGDALIERTEADIAAAASLAPTGQPGPRVAFLYLRGTAGVYLLAGPGSGADSLVEAIGAQDAGVASGLTRPFTPLTSEALIDAAPEVLLVMRGGLDSVGGVDGLVRLPGVAQTPAGRDRRVVTVDDGLLLNFGPRTGAVLRLLAEHLYAGAAAS